MLSRSHLAWALPAGALLHRAFASAEAAAAPPLAAASPPHTKPPPPTLVDARGRRCAEPTLLQVQAVFRHGARLPVSDQGCRDGLCTWTSADVDKSALLAAFGSRIELFAHGSGDALDPAQLFGGRGGLAGSVVAPGALTPVGLQQGVDLGAELRERYVDPKAAACAAVRPGFLLPSSWERARRLVHTRSTRVERTVYTAAGVLNGLYPGVGVPVEIALSGPPQHEFLVLNDASSPRLRELFCQGQRLSSEHLDEAQRGLIATIEAGAGWYVDDPEWKLIAYRDWYACRRAAGKGIPPSVEAVAAALDVATAAQMHHIFEGGAAFTDDPEGTRTEALRLAIGRLWSHLLETLARPDRALHLYSGHDWSVSPLLMCCVARDDPLLHGWPPFCSNFCIELWSTREADREPQRLCHAACAGLAAAAAEGDYHVRVLYNGRPVRLQCSGGATCTLAQFTRHLAPYCVRDYAEESKPRTARGAARSKFGFNK